MIFFLNFFKKKLELSYISYPDFRGDRMDVEVTNWPIVQRRAIVALEYMVKLHIQ